MLWPAGLWLVPVGYLSWCAVATGSDPAFVAVWWLTIGGGVLLPGVLMVRALRRRGGSVDADLAWGAVAGLLLTLATWAVGRVLDLTLPQVAVGAALAAGLVAVPAGRRRILRRAGPSWGWPTRLAVVAAVLVALRVAQTTGLRWVPAAVHDGGIQLRPDLWYHVALTGELRHSLPPDYPMVAGTPLNYHWFYYALAAQLGGDGSHDIDVVLRLLPSTLLCLLVLLAAAVAAVIARRRSAAVAAAILIAAVGPVGGSLWPAPQPFPAVGDAAMLWPVQTYWQWSPTQTLGWVFGVATLGLLVIAVRSAPADRDEPRWLLLPGLVGAAGAKSVQNALLAAFLLGGGLHLLARDRHSRDRPSPVARAVGAGVTVAVVSVIVARLLYPHSYGMRLAPGESAAALVGTITPGLTTALTPGASGTPLLAAGALGVAVVLRLAPTLLTAIGIAGLFVRPQDRWLGWGGLALIAAGVAGHLLFSHPGRSEWFFVIGAAPLLSTLAAAGAGPLIVDWWRHRQGWGRAVPLALTTGVVAAWTVVVTRANGTLDPLAVWVRRFGHPPASSEVPAMTQLGSWLVPWLWILGGVAVGAAAGMVASHRLTDRRRPRHDWISSLVVMGAVATAVCGAAAVAPLAEPGADPYPASMRAQVARAEARDHLVPVTSALAKAGAYVRSHAGPLDVVATNRIFVAPRDRGGGGDNRDFSVSALSGRRTDVGGYGYADQAVEMASLHHVSLSTVAFWDQPELRAELALITEPSASRLAAAWRRGIRWIVADERSGPVSAELARLCPEPFSEDGVHVYRVMSPAPGLSVG